MPSRCCSSLGSANMRRVPRMSSRKITLGESLTSRVMLPFEEPLTFRPHMIDFPNYPARTGVSV